MRIRLIAQSLILLSAFSVAGAFAGLEYRMPLTGLSLQTEAPPALEDPLQPGDLDSPSPPLSLHLADAILSPAQIGQPYSFGFSTLLTIEGADPLDTVRWELASDSTLPDGLSLSEDGAVSGSPTLRNVGGFPFTLTATVDSEGTEASASQTYVLNVNGVPLSFASLSMGYSHTCGLTATGAVWCWGSNSGQLGNGSMTDSSYAVPVTGLTSGVTQIASGYEYTCALQNGAVKCWGGSNGAYQLGSTAAKLLEPNQVPGLTAGVTQITAGGSTACAVQYGEVKCWGSHSSGQLGHGGPVTATARSATPVTVSNIGGSVAALSGGGTHMCALLTTGVLRCWGSNSYNTLGQPTEVSYSSIPVTVSGFPEGVRAIRAGGYQSCVELQNGEARCWGADNFGQLGNGGTNTNSPTPTLVTGLSGVTDLKSANHSVCAIASGNVYCWGRDSFGQLGDGAALTTRTAPSLVTGLTQAVELFAGHSTMCARRTGGDYACWGDGGAGQLGPEHSSSLPSPVSVTFQ